MLAAANGERNGLELGKKGEQFKTQRYLLAAAVLSFSLGISLSGCSNGTSSSTRSETTSGSGTGTAQEAVPLVVVRPTPRQRAVPADLVQEAAAGLAVAEVDQQASFQIETPV